QMIIPSTKADQANKIGSTTPKTIDGKKNCLLENAECPDWMKAAHAHFTMQDLGEDWKGCISSYEGFKEKLSYYSGKRLVAKGHPEEWNVWTSKNYVYGNVLTIKDVMQFGMAAI
ncbi:hypothetical protein H2248_003985, partial [Termitomyces sp. 'cryptogamus']